MNWVNNIITRGFQHTMFSKLIELMDLLAWDGVKDGRNVARHEILKAAWELPV